MLIRVLHGGTSSTSVSRASDRRPWDRASSITIVVHFYRKSRRISVPYVRNFVSMSLQLLIDIIPAENGRKWPVVTVLYFRISLIDILAL